MKYAKTLVSFSLTLLCMEASASWNEKYTRYLNGFDLVGVLKQKFPGTYNGNLPGTCNSMLDAAGKNRPATGTPNGGGDPTAFFVATYQVCLVGMWKDISANIGAITDPVKLRASMDRYYGPSVAMATGYMWEASKKMDTWEALSPEIRTELVQNAVREMIGPTEILEARGVRGGSKSLVEMYLEYFSGKTGLSIFEVARDLHIGLAMREEFLTY